MTQTEAQKTTEQKKAMRGLAEIRTPLKSKMQSRPKAKNAEYLSLYLLNKEKDRNVQEMRAISKRHTQLQDNLEFLKGHTAGLLLEITTMEGSPAPETEARSAPAGKKNVKPPSSLPAQWKSLKIDY